MDERSSFFVDAEWPKQQKQVYLIWAYPRPNQGGWAGLWDEANTCKKNLYVTDKAVSSSLSYIQNVQVQKLIA